MGWKRTYTEEIDRPQDIYFHKWLFSLFILCILLLVIYYFFHEFVVANNASLLAFFSPLLLWVLILSVQVIFYSRAIQDYSIWLENRLSINREWEAWGSRYVSVMNSSLHLPGKVDVLFLSDDELETQYGLVNKSDDITWKQHDWYACFQTLTNHLELYKLPYQLTQEFIILTDCDESMYSQIEEDFFRTVEKTNRTEGHFLLHISPSMSFGELDLWLKDSEEKIYIVMVLQMEEQTSCSDAMACLMFATDDVTAKYKLTEKARIYRPMVVNSNNFNSDLNIFIDTQKISKNAAGLVGDSQRLFSVSSNVLQCFNDNNAQLKIDNIHLLESLCGLPGGNAVWLTAALTISVVVHKNSDYLMMSENNDDWIITTIHPMEHS
ncbi:TPA: hypothetical protein J1188_002583 [Escherichia coli]|nr:hypothetical protein [Escherichia coli]